MTDDEAEARQQSILSQPLRIAELPQDELGPDLRELVHRIGAQLGYEPPEVLTTYFAVLAHHPELFKRQLDMGIFLFSGCAIPTYERELAVLRIAWTAGAPYEWGEHVDIGRKLGMTPEVTDRVRAGPDAPGWSAHEAALLRAVDEAIADRMISDATWAVLAESWSEAQLIELPCLVGQYLGVAILQNSLRMPLARTSKGFAER
jgi:alkylhydroperoxidase family enzyme